MSTDTQGISDEQIDEAWTFATGGTIVTDDMRAFARAVLALQEADALAAIKAALDLGIELTWQKMIMEIAGDTIDDMDSPLSAKVRELSARADAIRLLGEDAGRGESPKADGDYARDAEACGAKVDWNGQGGGMQFTAGAWGRFCDTLRGAKS